jgi:hypothetical protein
MICPVFNCTIVKRMQINWAYFFGFLNGVDSIFSQDSKDSLTYLEAIEVSIHLRVFGFD